jgi:hypothetical protein
MLVDWYKEKQSISSESIAIICVWDDIDAVPSRVLHYWLRLCAEDYKSMAIYNVLRVSRVKANSILQSIFINNVG